MTELQGVAPLPSLPDISEVIPFGPSDQECFDEIRDVLIKHNALTRFGLTLLHQHFDLDREEVLVESVDVENRTLTSMPGPSIRGAGVIETSWRLDDPTGRRRCETLCVQDRDREGNSYHRRQHYMTR